MLSAEKRRVLEPSAHVVRNVNAILFKLDQGAASSLLVDSPCNDGQDDVVWSEEAFLGTMAQPWGLDKASVRSTTRLTDPTMPLQKSASIGPFRFVYGNQLRTK
jgi:hypothetical protein